MPMLSLPHSSSFGGCTDLIRGTIETEAVIKIELVLNAGAHINAVSDGHLLCVTLCIVVRWPFQAYNITSRSSI